MNESYQSQLCRADDAGMPLPPAKGAAMGQTCAYSSSSPPNISWATCLAWPPVSRAGPTHDGQPSLHGQTWTVFRPFLRRSFSSSKRAGLSPPYFRFVNLIFMNLVNSPSCLPGTDRTSSLSSASFWVMSVFCTIDVPSGVFASVVQRTVFESLS